MPTPALAVDYVRRYRIVLPASNTSTGLGVEVGTFSSRPIVLNKVKVRPIPQPHVVVASSSDQLMKRISMRERAGSHLMYVLFPPRSYSVFCSAAGRLAHHYHVATHRTYETSRHCRKVCAGCDSNNFCSKATCPMCRSARFTKCERSGAVRIGSRSLTMVAVCI